MIRSWLATLGDFTPLGWTITALYFAAALMCRQAGRTEDATAPAWRAAAWILLALGLNKQLDLQTLLLHAARHGLKATGLYGYKHTVSLLFLILLAGLAARMSYRLARAAGRIPRGLATACVGLLVLLVFILLRSVIVARSGLSGSSLPALHLFVELTGVALCGAGAALALRRRG